MRVCIHRGTKEIGGTCIEIESQGKRIVLDVGLPLDAIDAEAIDLHPVQGFDQPHSSLLAVVISHPHQDHYGLANRLPPETYFLIGEAAERILKASALFSPAGLKLSNTQHLKDRVPIQLGPFLITPFLVDHSAYDSYAILVEADGKRLFYTADFRTHGRKGALTDRLIANPPGDVNVLLMEGTCIGRDVGINQSSEDDLVDRFVGVYNATPGMALVWCSGQNIDRLVTIFKACRKTNRQLIIDVYTAEILKATGNMKLPQADWSNIRVFLPSSQRSRIVAEKQFAVAECYKERRIYPENLPKCAARSVMLFRPSLARDLERANCLKDASLICSLWRGYIAEGRNSGLLEWLSKHRLPVHHVHTSGHASTDDLKRMRNAFPNAVAVPIHLEDVEEFQRQISNSLPKNDGEWWEVE